MLLVPAKVLADLDWAQSLWRRAAGEIPKVFSISHRINRFDIARFASRQRRWAIRESRSMCIMYQSGPCRPLVATYCALHSIISLGMSTFAGHSSRHWRQLIQSSETSFTRSSASNAGSSLPVTNARIRLALARGVASSRGAMRKMGHIRKAYTLKDGKVHIQRIN